MYRKKIKLVSKISNFLIGLLAFGYTLAARADYRPSLVEAKSLGDIARNIVQSFQSIGELLIATSYIAGIAFIVSSIFKFKQHRDNPTQIPLGTPLSLFLIGIILMFLPGIIGPAGLTIFGGTTSSLPAGGFTGNKSLQYIPGAQNQ